MEGIYDSSLTFGANFSINGFRIYFSLSEEVKAQNR